MNLELTVEKLKRHINPDDLGIETTESLAQLSGIIGQKRAVNALQFGLQIDGRGYNIYVAGPPGTGKMTSVQTFLEELASKKDTPPDWIYVNNFHDPYNPTAIRLPAGTGVNFQQDMDHLLDHIRGELPKIFESEDYTAQKEEILSDLKRRRDAVSKEINETAASEGFNLQPTPMGIVFVPLKNGERMSEEEFESLPGSEKEELEKRREKLQSEMQTLSKKMRKIEREVMEKVRDLDKRVALNLVGGIIEDLIEKYEDYPDVENYLKDVQQDVVDNVDTFKALDGKSDEQGAAEQFNPQLQMLQKMTLKKYKVNVLVDNSKQKGAPVIVEFNPTYNNLLGRIEKEMQMGALNTDFTMIKAGSLPRANGGFLVLPVEDVLSNLSSYDGLKRALRSCEVQIEELGERLGFMTTKSLRPQPIPVDVKVVLVGPPMIYRLLHAYDTEFSELFKVKADYDTRMSHAEENVKNFLGFISTYCQKENLNHLHKTAAAKILEHASRMAEDQDKISTEFGDLADLIREANFWAKQDGQNLVKGEHVQKALDEKIYRSNLIEERIQEMIERGVLLIDTEGAEVGQVNGLSVLDIGDYQFGRPSRITATVGPGRGNIIDIEREVKLGGPIHSKGVLIISGFLTKTFAQGRPLTLSARLVFEQSYQGVEGDSASSTELYAVLSALANVPIKQGIAVTGSVNQHGNVQAIGGINHKIEGFFDVCKVKGLTGDQGIIMPESNLKNLMLREDVIEAVKSKKFHIWPVKTIDEGIEILTGIPAGELQEDGTFTADSIKERVRQQLLEFADAIKQISEPEKKSNGDQQGI